MISVIWKGTFLPARPRFALSCQGRRHSDQSTHQILHAAPLRRPKQSKRSMRVAAAASEEGVVNSPSTPQRVGVLGGGQLGKMLAIAAARLGVTLKVLDPTENCPAAGVAEQVVGNFNDSESVRQFVTNEDILTVEIEHVDVEALRWIQENAEVDVEPTPETLAIIQDKFRQKEHFNKNGVKVTSYIDIGGPDTADLAVMVLSFPFMLKAKRLAFDGRGNAVVKNFGELERAVNSLGGYDQGVYGEKWVPFTKELAVMVARSRDGSTVAFPVTETVHRDSICYVTRTPANIPEELRQQAQLMAEKAVGCLEGAGIFGVEMFVVEGGELMLNEVAPRPHNSGHYTIEACEVSQFEQHLRAILGLPLGSAALKVGSSIMLNVLGEADGDAGAEAAKSLLDKAYATPGANVHWYGKKGVSKNRKVGHITIVAETANEALERLAAIEPSAADSLKRSDEAFEEDWKKAQAAKEAQEKDGRGGGPPVLAVAVDPLGTQTEATCQRKRQHQGGAAAPHGAGAVTASAVFRENNAPADQAEVSTSGATVEVAIIMGSDSDLPTMRAAAEVLQEMGISCEVTVVSAHRTPDRLMEFARSAHQRGLRVIIAGAGGAAHLPGMVASMTPLPVIGVPVTPKGAHLDGLDALMSIVQMPKGVPVATVAIGNAANAGLLAARILATSQPALLNKMLAYQALQTMITVQPIRNSRAYLQESMRAVVLKKAERLENEGWEHYQL